ncbi:MAG: ThiF family adenylyltransferase [Rhizobiales bacterium]|nr:ThiF family adenylyltransferase [Hyphomicrobiales bacterium]
MPDANDRLVERFETAVAAIEVRWEELGQRPQKLDQKALASYRRHAAVRGWRFNAEFPDGIRRLDVIVSNSFPSSPARVALVDRPPFMTWPHVEKDGVLCLLPDYATLSVDAPYDGVISLLDEAFALVGASIRGEKDDDFRMEFLTYWDHAKRGTARTILSLIEPSAPSRCILVWTDKRRTIIAEDEDQLRAWLRNFAPKTFASAIKPMVGVLAWLDEVPMPAQYPRSAKAVYGLADQAGAAGLIDAGARAVPANIFVLFGANTSNGPALAATAVNRPKVVRNRDPLTAGFRPSFVPEDVLHTRLFGGAPPDRNSIERIDPAWIHGRGHDTRFRKLRDSTVAVLGCGSVGAPVASTLARAGVGKLVLVDEQTLKGGNVGRHTLGVGAIGEFKAMALARQIRETLPHIDVTCHVSTVQELLLRDDNPLGEADLIVSVLGNWPAESLLDEWQATQKDIIPIVYGWTEPHAAAGHAIVISSGQDRLRSGLDAYGTPDVVAVRWTEDTRRYEPACGAAFDPYGPVELGFVASMISQATLDVIQGDISSGTHRIWLARRRLVEAAGGLWSDEIRAIAPQALEGATIIERKWGRDTRTLAA